MSPFSRRLFVAAVITYSMLLIPVMIRFYMSQRDDTRLLDDMLHLDLKDEVGVMSEKYNVQQDVENISFMLKDILLKSKGVSGSGNGYLE